MRRIFIGGIVSILAAMLILTSGAAIASADGDMMPMSNHSDDGSPGLNFHSGNEMNESQRQQRIQEMCEEGLQHMMLGPIDYHDGVVEGYFVQFEYDETNGTIANYSVRTSSGFLTVFDSIGILGFTPEGMKSTGSVFKQWNDTFHMIAHNNPTAMVHGASNNTTTTMSFLLVEEFTITEVEVEGNLSDVIGISNGEINALIGVGNGTITNESVQNGTYVNVTSNEGQMFFRMKPYFAGSGAHFENQIMSAIANGTLTNEMSLMIRQGDVVSVESAYNEQYRMRVQNAERNMVTLQVSSEMHSGKVMMLRFDGQSIDASDGIKVKLDGMEVNRGGVAEVLQAHGSNLSDARYCLVDEGDNYSLVVYVPHFSTHTLEIESVAGVSDLPFPLIGVAALAMVVVGVAAVVISRRR